LPRIKSAKKRVDVAERNRQRNIDVKSAVRTAVKKVINATDAATRVESLKQAYSLIDSAILKGILHKNTGSRIKSRMALLVQKTA